MSEEFWWKRAGLFYGAARRSQFVRRIQQAFFAQVDRLDLPAGAKVLDAGCGDGNSSFPLVERGFDVTGLDFGDAVLVQARRRQARLGTCNARFLWGDLNEPLAFEAESFDLVTSLHALMKVEGIHGALAEFHRVLRPGGYVVVSITSSDEEFSSWLRRYLREHGVVRGLWDVRWLVAWGVPYVLLTQRAERRNEWRWSPETLSAEMEAVGFETLHREEVPYTHVGCALGVFRKAAATGPGDRSVVPVT